MAQISVSRKALYDLIWAKMLRGAAAELGISDVGLRKVCDGNDIPRPPPGFLQMKEPKRSQAIKALPDPDDDWSIEIEAVTAEKQAVAERVKELDLDITPNPEIQQRVREIERLIGENGRVDERGILNQQLRADHHLIRVSRPQLRRASDLLVSCLSAMHNLGYPSEFKEEKPTNSYHRDQGYRERWVEVRNNKSTVNVWVEELSHRATRPITPAERAERVKSMPWYRDDYKPTLVPNGKIYLCFGWNNKIRIDLNLDKALVALEEQLQLIETRRIKMEKWEEDRQRKRRKEIQRKLKVRYREVRKEAILREAKAWSEAGLIRDYVQAISDCDPEDLGFDPKYVEKWMAFANRYADELDPIASGQAMKKQKNPSVEYYGSYYEVTTEPTDPIDEEEDEAIADFDAD
jgi:hypothetical protein